MRTSLLSQLQAAGILKYGEFTLRSGVQSSFYCDIKEALGNPKILKLIIKEITSRIPSKSTCIAGSGYGGITLASLVSYEKKLPLVLVRDTVKNHGTKKIIDGYVPTKKDFICIVDDVFTTGSSINDTKEKLLPYTNKFVTPVVVLNRSNKNTVVSIINL